MSRLGAPFRPFRRSSPADLVPSAEVQKLSSDLGEAYRRINELEAAIRDHRDHQFPEGSYDAVQRFEQAMAVNRKLWAVLEGAWGQERPKSLRELSQEWGLGEPPCDLADNARAFTRKPLTLHDRLVSNPCDVTVTDVSDSAAAWGHCHTCRTAHVIDRAMFDAGRGPWRRVDGETDR